MNKVKAFLVCCLLSLPMTLLAGEQTVTLKVEGMTCMSCPYQVKSALKGVEGVLKADATLETREASVTFDDTLTNVEALTQATANAGFPSELVVTTQ